jgi:hypoxanthine phosphoribosyltransferase
MVYSPNFQPNLAGNKALGKILYPGSVIQQKVAELGKQITEDFEGKKLLLISVLRGGIFFLTDLARKIDLPLSIDFMGISTYASSKSKTTGVVKITKDLEEPVEGKDLLIVEDIIDTGLTISYLLRNLKARYPSSVSICTLLDRNVRRIADIDISYKCFNIGEEYVVGYGLDYRQKFRNLDAIYMLDTSTVRKEIEFISGNRE